MNLHHHPGHDPSFLKHHDLPLDEPSWQLPRQRRGREFFQPAFVIDALELAQHERRSVHHGWLVHHSDLGSQYISTRYTERLGEAGIEFSVGSMGDSYDNALAETIKGL